MSPEREEELRIAIGAAIIRSGLCDDDDVEPLLQWHPCESPHCGRRSACSGVPYVSDQLWEELKPIFEKEATDGATTGR